LFFSGYLDHVDLEITFLENRLHLISGKLILSYYSFGYVYRAFCLDDLFSSGENLDWKLIHEKSKS